MSTPAHTARLSRRTVLASLAATACAAPRLSFAQDGPLRICQSIALSGPLGDLGQAMHQGAKAHFASLNAKGGVNGRLIELAVADDGYDAKRALANVGEFLADRSTFALFNCMGTPMIDAMLPQVLETGVPFFSPFTGALLARPKARNVINIRASYPDEAEQLVQHLATIGIKRIGIAYQNNAFGKEVLEGARVAMEKHKITGPVTVTVENNGSDAAQAAAKLVDGNPEAVLIGLAGKPTIDFVKAIRAKRRGVPLYALSVMGAAATLRALGDDGVGMTITQVMPSPANVTAPVVREFQQAWKESEVKLDTSHLALEGYINARVFSEVLRRAGRNPSRSAFLDAAWGLKKFDLGGFEVNFTEPGRNGSRFIELTMVGRDGRFVR